MTWNIIAASLKGLSKYRRMALSFLEYFRFRDTDVLICIMLIRKVMMPCAVQLKWFMNWIKKISGNNEAILVFDKKRLEQREFPWQQHYRCHLETLLVPVCFCQKPNILSFNTFKCTTEVQEFNQTCKSNDQCALWYFLWVQTILLKSFNLCKFVVWCPGVLADNHPLFSTNFE